jgi:hypothetical protein
MPSSRKPATKDEGSTPRTFRVPCSVVLLALLLLAQFPSRSSADIALTAAEEKCLEATGKLFDKNERLIAARHNFATAMQMDMTTTSTMTARYPDASLADYDAACTQEGGTIHAIKIDFFDCTLKKMKRSVELTLKNFANCLAATDECASFDQENLLEEAWEEMGLHCELEAGPTSGNADGGDDGTKKDEGGDPIVMDDDLARQEKKDAARGADELDKAEKAAEYSPKEEEGKKKKRKGGSRFSFFLFACLVGGAGYYVYHRRRSGQRLPWGGVTTSRFQSQGPPMMFQTNYNLLSGEEELNFDVRNELQLSSNLMA